MSALEAFFAPAQRRGVGYYADLAVAALLVANGLLVLWPVLVWFDPSPDRLLAGARGLALCAIGVALPYRGNAWRAAGALLTGYITVKTVLYLPTVRLSAFSAINLSLLGAASLYLVFSLFRGELAVDGTLSRGTKFRFGVLLPLPVYLAASLFIFWVVARLQSDASLMALGWLLFVVPGGLAITALLNLAVLFLPLERRVSAFALGLIVPASVLVAGYIAVWGWERTPFGSLIGS